MLIPTVVTPTLEHIEQFRAAGYVVLGPPALTTAAHGTLVAESARQQRNESWRLTGSSSRGEIEQDSTRAHLGPAARQLCSSPEVLDLLAALHGAPVTPGWDATCYTAYTGPGQHLGEHCDKPSSCRIAMITYLTVRWSPNVGPSRGLGLQIFDGDNSATPLTATVTARANRILILNGAHHAHRRPALCAGEHLEALTACFRSLGA